MIRFRNVYFNAVTVRKPVTQSIRSCCGAFRGPEGVVTPHAFWATPLSGYPSLGALLNVKQLPYMEKKPTALK